MKELKIRKSCGNKFYKQRKNKKKKNTTYMAQLCPKSMHKNYRECAKIKSLIYQAGR